MSSLSVKVSICVPVYNNVNNFKNLFYSITGNLPSPCEDIEFIVYNDGSTVRGIHEELEEFCNLNRIQYIYSKQNKGVAYAWNRLTEAANSDIVILLNDDTRVHSKDWVNHIKYTFNNNERVGIVYWCQRQIDSNWGVFTGYTKDSMRLLSRKNNYPYLRHGFCGAFFAFRKSIWSQIKQPDNSIGFWEDLLSYGEEIDFSIEFLNRGYIILQLPVLFEHLRSQTFASNPEKKLRSSLSCYLTQKEFYQILFKFSTCFGLSSRELNLLKLIIFYDISKLSIIKSILLFKKSKIFRISRLDYSMAMLLKKWRNKTALGFNGEEYLMEIYTTGYPSALQDAIQNNNFHPPKNIYFISIEKTEQILSFEECIDHSLEPLV